VFPGRHGNIARAEDVSTELTAICKQAGIPRITPNELRHTATSLANDAGVRFEELADQLGHKDVRMVSQVYRHRIRPTVGDGTAATMNNLFASGTA
jgi:integrase